MLFPYNLPALPEDHFSVAGFAANKPLKTPVNLPENRRINRRVEIVAIPTKNVEGAEEEGSIGPGGVKLLVPGDANVEWPEPM